MQLLLLRQWCPTLQLALLLLLPLRLNALCPAATPKPSHDLLIATSPKSIDRRERPVPLSVQPLSIRPTTRNNHPATLNTTTTPPPPPSPYTFRLLDFRAIATSPETEAKLVAAFDRFCEACAIALLDFDLLEAQYVSVRFGDLSLNFYNVGEYVSVLAMKAVVLQLLHLIGKGLRGFFKGEVLDVQAEVRMVFTFGIRGLA